MFDLSGAQERCGALIEKARKAGADAADAVAIGSVSESVGIRLGKLEDVDRSESEHLGLRVFVGQRSASIQATDLSDAALDELASRAVSMARAAPEDQFAGIAPPELLSKGPFPDCDLSDSAEPGPQQLRALAEECEDAALAVQGVTNSEGGNASFGRSVVALATSNGFAGAYGGTSHGLSASVLAGEGARMQRDYAWRQARYGSDLPTPAEIGEMAGKRAVARLDPVRPPSGNVPVVFDPRVAGSLLGHVVAAMSGPAIARKASFLIGKLDESLFAPGIRIVDDPHRKRGLRSRPFDGEGLPTAPRALVEKGKITGWLTNVASARQLGLAPTGHASRSAGGAPGVAVSNLHCEPGNVSRDALIADIADGVLVTELIGLGVNPVTGDYSRGATGFRIANGEIAGPIAEFTVAGNLLAMFRAMTPADDLEWHRAVNAPTLRVYGMTVAGG